MTKRFIVASMIIPSVITLGLGVAFIITPYIKISGDQSGMQYGANLLLLGALFFISAIVTLVFVLSGLAQLRKLRSK